MANIEMMVNAFVAAVVGDIIEACGNWRINLKEKRISISG